MNPDVFSLLERATTEHGGRTAVVGDGRSTDYRALLERASALAGSLQARGLAADDRVGILADNAPEYLETYFAAAGAGLVLCPLNTRLAPRELADVVRDAGARRLVADARHAEAAERLRASTGIEGVLSMDDESWAAALEAGAGRFRRHVPDPDEPVHLYYTSGTTGRSKGVVLTQRNVFRHAQHAVAELGLTERDTWGHYAPLFHLADAWATFAVTAVGGAHTCVAPFEPRAVVDSMQRFGVTLTNLVPTMIVRLLRHLGERPADLPDLRLLLSGGAPIAPALVAQIQRAFGCEYAQTYGMTETSPYLTISLLDERLRAEPESLQLRRRARTGRPFRGVELEVVDEAGRAVPPDDSTVGEIRVRGETVSPGYWGRPEETAEAFRDGWLHTGDLAVVDALGWVDIVDRRKDVILSGGESVYSIEVENALSEHPSVAQAAVFGRPDAEWGERVCAAVVPVPDADPDGGDVAARLVEHCRERLASFKVPREVHLVDELPTTGSGKVHKPALRVRFGARVDRG